VLTTIATFSVWSTPCTSSSRAGNVCQAGHADEAQRGCHSPWGFRESQRPKLAVGTSGGPLHAQTRQVVEHGGTELSVISSQYLDRRIAEAAMLRRQVESWESARNQTEAKVRWRFTTADYCNVLEKLYPVLEYSTNPAAYQPDLFP
jgi:hypothetical protein